MHQLTLEYAVIRRSVLDKLPPRRYPSLFGTFAVAAFTDEGDAIDYASRKNRISRLKDDLCVVGPNGLVAVIKQEG